MAARRSHRGRGVRTPRFGLDRAHRHGPPRNRRACPPLPLPRSRPAAQHDEGPYTPQLVSLTGGPLGHFPSVAKWTSGAAMPPPYRRTKSRCCRVRFVGGHATAIATGGITLPGATFRSRRSCSPSREESSALSVLRRRPGSPGCLFQLTHERGARRQGADRNPYGIRLTSIGE